MNDPTSEIYYAQLVEEESTPTVLAALREVIEQKGVFCAPYKIARVISSSCERPVSRWTTIV
jgi:hypothetical protein